MHSARPYRRWSRLHSGRAHTPSNGSESCSRPPNLKLGCGEGSLDHVKLVISAREPTPYSVRLGAQQATHLRPPSTHFPCPSNRHDSHTNGEGVHRRRQAAGPSGFAVGDLPPLLSHFLSLPWTGCSLPSSPSRIGPAPCGAASSSRGQQTFRHQRSGTSRHRLTVPPRLDPRRASLQASRHVCRRLTTPSRRFHRTICRGYLSETRGTTPLPTLGILSVVQIGGRTRRGQSPIFPC